MIKVDKAEFFPIAALQQNYIAVIQASDMPDLFLIEVGDRIQIGEEIYLVNGSIITSNKKFPIENYSVIVKKIQNANI